MDDKSLALLVFKAIHALGIDVPIYGVVLLPDERLQLSLYGGRVVVFPEDDGRCAMHGSTTDDGNGDTAAVPDPAASKVTEIRPKAEVSAAEELVVFGKPSPKKKLRTVDRGAGNHPNP